MQTINFIYPEKSDIAFRIDTYPDSQTHLVLLDELNRKDMVSIYTRLSNLNDVWILMQLADICHRNGIIIKNVHISYLFAARTDRLFSFNEALDLDVIAKCLNFVNANLIYILEPHSDRIFYFCKSIKEFNSNIHDALRENHLIVFPDEGAKDRYYRKGYNSIYAKKKRLGKDKIEIELPEISNINHQICVFDDLCDGGGTFFAIYNELHKRGANDIHLVVCHAIQKQPLIELSKLYKTITITNSYKDWDKEYLPDNIKVIKVYEDCFI